MAPGTVKIGVCPIFMFFRRLLELSGAIWMSSQKKQIELLENMFNVRNIYQKMFDASISKAYWKAPIGIVVGELSWEPSWEVYR